MGVEVDSSWLWRYGPWVFTFLSTVASILLFSAFLVKHRTSSRQTPPTDAVSDPQNDAGGRSEPVRNQPGYEYEVFLSFRGPDTRTGFTDYLYNALIDAGVRAFRDDEELRKGQEIGPDLLEAIKQSKVSVPIFSKDYASSKWCLKEVAQMVECRNTGQTILPIFYHVAPNEVRHQTGNYGVAFSQHKRRYDADTVQRWRDALAEVGKLKGWDVENTAGGYEGQLTKLVVAEILKELKKSHLLVTDSLVGADDQTERVMQLLEVGAKDVRIVVLWGMGGIGKTTLAKSVYNQILDQFEGCSFLKDIRETSASRYHGLAYLQSQLVADITRRERRDFTGTDDGINELKRRFRDKKVLILLDDIDHRKQLNALAKEVEWFGPGSRIIVTTRNKDVLQAAQVDRSWIYEVEEMNQDQALQLFCRHAFRNGSPVAELSALAKDIAGTTGGLPLALEIIGSFLATKSKVVWESTLEKLKAMPNAEVQDKLRISYDALDHEQKQIFLDVACIFIGEDIQVVTHMWRDCQFFPEVGIEVLLLMSLIKVGDDNKLWMHDQLRDLGREIVRQENYIEPEKRSRLWHGEEARDVLEKEKGSAGVEAIRIDYTNESDYTFTDQHFRNLSNLRFLRLESCDLSGNFHKLLPKLRWLSWHNSSFDRTATNLNLDNLVILDLSQTEVGDDWVGWSSVKMAVKLKVLYLNHCNHLTRSPDFSAMTNLERLSMNNCHRLELIDPSIGKLKSLTYLDVSFCWNIQKLPDQIGSLKSLKELIVDGTQIQDIPISRYMKKLEVVHAKHCISLTRVPDSIGHATSLSDLLLDSSNIIELPDSIGSIEKLRHLSLKNCSLLREIPDSVGQLRSLKKLNLSCTSVTRLPNSVGDLENLEVLDIDHCGFLRFPSALGNLRKLKVINASFCVEMEGQPPPELGEISRLAVLRLDQTEITALPESIGRLSHLKTLDLKACESLHTLPSLPASLSQLRVTSKSPAPIPNLPALINLRELTFWSCPQLSKLPAEISELSKLEKLEFYRTGIRALPNELGALPRLKSLTISGCRLRSLPTLAPSLYELSVVGCNFFSRLPDLSNLRNLSDLRLCQCPELKEIPGLRDLVFLTRLVVSSCPKVINIDGIEGLEGLRFLDVSFCENLERLPDLSKLKKLSELKATECKNLSEIEGLDDLCSLRCLEIRCCASLENLPDLSSLKLLESLVAEGCEKLQELEGLDELEALEELDIRNCKEIRRLPNLSKLKSLTWLKMSGCDNLSEVPGLEDINPLSVSRY